MQCFLLLTHANTSKWDLITSSKRSFLYLFSATSLSHMQRCKRACFHRNLTVLVFTAFFFFFSWTMSVFKWNICILTNVEQIYTFYLSFDLNPYNSSACPIQIFTLSHLFCLSLFFGIWDIVNNIWYNFSCVDSFSLLPLTSPIIIICLNLF